MRIFIRGTLRKFWEQYPDSQAALETWYAIVDATIFDNPNQIINHFKGADTAGNQRIIFNIYKNKYRLIAKFEYQYKSAYIRFIGTYEEYDKIKNIDLI